MADQPSHEYRRIICSHCGDEIDVPVYCGSRFCPVCSVPRLLRVRSRIAYILGLAKTAEDFQLKMITLTIPNQRLISTGCKILHKSFRRLRSTRAWRKRILGGLYVIEVSGLPHHWHVHLHVLVDCRFFPKHLLDRCWRSVSPGRITDIRRIPLGKAVGYVTKYLAKPSVPASDLPDVDLGLRSVRLFQPFGVWHGLSKGWKKAVTVCRGCGKNAWAVSDIFYSQLRSRKSDRPPDFP